MFILLQKQIKVTVVKMIFLIKNFLISIKNLISLIITLIINYAYIIHITPRKCKITVPLQALSLGFSKKKFERIYKNKKKYGAVM